MVGLLHPSTLRNTQKRKAAAVIDQDAGDSESDRRKKKKRSKAEKKDKALKDKVHGSVSTNPVPVLEKALVPSVVPEAVGGPMSFTAVTVAVCKEEEEEEEDLAFEKKKKKKEQKKQKKTKREGDLRTGAAVAVPVLEDAQQGLHAVKEEKLAP